MTSLPLAPPPYDGPTLLVTLTGRDRPGIVAALFAACATHPVDVLDVEQVVIRGRIVLGALLTAPRDEQRLRRDLAGLATGLDVHIDVDHGRGDAAQRPGRRVRVTVLGAPLRPGAFAAVAGRIADTGANIERIVRMARYPVTAVELDVSGADPDRLRLLLAAEAVQQRVDIAVQAADIHRYAQRLVVLDVDSTLVQGEVIDVLAAQAGRAEEVAALTARAMTGDLDFAESLRQRVELLAGVSEQALDDVYDALVLTPGARTLVRTLRRLGYRLALVSGGFTRIIDRLARDLDIDYAAANELEVAGGRLTGRVVGEVLDRAGKAAALRRFAAEAGIPLEHTVAVGDGANDVDMLAAAGLGVAFNAKPVVRELADTTVSVPYLDTIAFLLGITREEIEAADAG